MGGYGCRVARPTAWLKNARRRAGYASQAALAKALGVSRGAVGNWESATDRPSMENAERLATVLGRQRAEVLARFGYPIGGGGSVIEQPATMPPEWTMDIQRAVAAGIVDGVAQALEALRSEGLLGEPGKPAGQSRRRQSA
jgi:DNA-binding XRE family transcriptional regulator